MWQRGIRLYSVDIEINDPCVRTLYRRLQKQMVSLLFPLGYCCVRDGGGREERGERDLFSSWCAIEPIELERQKTVQWYSNFCESQPEHSVAYLANGAKNEDSLMNSIAVQIT